MTISPRWLNDDQAQVAHINLENIPSAKVAVCVGGLGGGG